MAKTIQKKPLLIMQGSAFAEVDAKGDGWYGQKMLPDAPVEYLCIKAQHMRAIVHILSHVEMDTFGFVGIDAALSELMIETVEQVAALAELINQQAIGEVCHG
ncbi:hypothetical protein JOE11_005068 [Robbsia andropogonis]|uniref:hypothetical protein n=1 Tax=Robbsia andropogonis TaxID=28092 RepID=UPI003D1AE9EC